MLSPYHLIQEDSGTNPSGYSTPLRDCMKKKIAIEKGSNVMIWKSFVVLLVLALGTLGLQTYQFMRIRSVPVETEVYDYDARENAFTTDTLRMHAVDVDMILEQKRCNCGESSRERKNMKYLTIFTTMRDTPDKEEIHNNTIRNWVSLMPFVQPILYIEGNASGIHIRARNAGWKLRPVPRLNHGIPVFKAMYEDALSVMDTPYYAYANADILFDNSLVDTLSSLYESNIIDENFKWTAREGSVKPNATTAQLDKRPATGGLLLIGRRTNVNITDIHRSPLSLKDTAKAYGSLFVTNAQDYFITTKNGLPWSLIPELVIGRVGYDNWLVAETLDWKITTIDMSSVLLAIHQTGSDGNLAGWSTEDETLCLNRVMVSPFDYRPGHTKCCRWVAERDVTGTIRIFRRRNISKDCRRDGNPPKSKKCN